MATHQTVVLYCQTSPKALSLVHVFSLYIVHVYINDMPDTLKSNVRLFADDTILALTDCHTLQSDLHKLEKWEEE